MHLREDITFYVDSRCSLNQFQPTGFVASENGALGDVKRPLAIAGSKRPRISHLADPTDKLFLCTFALNNGAAAGPVDVEPTCCESAAENHAFGILTDIDEAPRPYDTVTKATDIYVAAFINLSKREEGKVKAPAVVEIELIGLVNHGVIIAPSPGFVASCGHATDEPLLVGQHDRVDRLLLCRDGGYPRRYSGSKIANSATEQFESSAPSNNLADGEWHCSHLQQRHLHFTGVGWVVGCKEGLRLFGVDHD